MGAHITARGSSRGAASGATLGPLAVVAVVWALIAVFFPTEEPQRTEAVTRGGQPAQPGPAIPTPSATDGPRGGEGAAPDQGSSPQTGAPGATLPAGGESSTGERASAAPETTAAGQDGASRGGVECGPGVRQIPNSSYAAPCVPAWSGDNGGATYRGVTADKIRIVERTFPESANSRAVDAVGEQAGAASDAEQRAASEKIRAYYDEMYELYGREIEWIRWESQYGNSTDEAQSKGREEACLDADVIANEMNAFAVVGTQYGAVSGPFAECAAERGLLVLNGAAYFSETFYRDRHPFVWAITMECERITHLTAEYVGKRLHGKKAKWAGDPLYQEMNRTFGVYVPNNEEYQRCTDIYEARAQADYGIEPGSRYNYTLDVSRFPDEAARGIVQFKADGVTTVVLACDPISVIFLTQSATSSDYYPEWLLLGVAAQDTDALGQLYDQEQADGHMFGMSQLGDMEDLWGPESEPGRVYHDASGEQIIDGTDARYGRLTYHYNMIQAAGPTLTPETVAAGAWSLPESGAPDYPYGAWTFQDAPDGTKGGRDHTATEDSREIYWTREFVSQTNKTPGTFVETYDGKRFSNGDWPAEDPPIYPNG